MLWILKITAYLMAQKKRKTVVVRMYEDTRARFKVRAAKSEKSMQDYLDEASKAVIMIKNN